MANQALLQSEPASTRIPLSGSISMLTLGRVGCCPCCAADSTRCLTFAAENWSIDKAMDTTNIYLFSFEQGGILASVLFGFLPICLLQRIVESHETSWPEDKASPTLLASFWYPS